MDWRSWVFNQLRTDATILEDIPEDSIFGSGALQGAPARRPFILVTFGTELPEINDADAPVATSQRATVYVHDDPGDYLRIGRVLARVRLRLAGSTAGMSAGGIVGLWEGDSADLGDDLFKTITRFGEYRFVGKVA